MNAAVHQQYSIKYPNILSDINQIRSPGPALRRHLLDKHLDINAEHYYNVLVPEEFGSCDQVRSLLIGQNTGRYKVPPAESSREDHGKYFGVLSGLRRSDRAALAGL